MRTASIKVDKFNLKHLKEYIDHGKYLYWFKNGLKRLERKCKNGKFHGKSIRFYETGQKRWEDEYQNGVLKNMITYEKV